jgi:hypothetical protein
MAYIKVLRMKTDDFMKKYSVSQKINKVFSNENIRIFAWVFIITRIYKMYLLVNKLNYQNH